MSSSAGLPSILPTYKVQMLEQKKRSQNAPIYSNMFTLLVCFCIIMLFVVIISNLIAYKDLQQYIQADAESNDILGKIGLPNTKNDIKKWSMNHLYGIDLTSLGPPPVISKNKLRIVSNSSH